MPPRIDPDLFSKCGLCAGICPMNLFEHEAGKVPVAAYPEECWHCNACVLDCPAGAVELRLPLNYMLLHVRADSLQPKEE